MFAVAPGSGVVQTIISFEVVVANARNDRGAAIHATLFVRRQSRGIRSFKSTLTYRCPMCMPLEPHF